MTEQDFAIWAYFHARFRTPLSRISRWPPFAYSCSPYWVYRPTRADYGRGRLVTTWSSGISNSNRRRRVATKQEAR